MNKLTIKSWALDDRPREKLETKGKSVLSDAELIAILIATGNKEESAVDLSKRILMSVDCNINQLATLTLEDLTRFKGIGNAKAITIITALELGKRRHVESLIRKPKIISSNDVFKAIHLEIGELKHEEFWALYLDNSNSILDKLQLSRGGLTSTLVDVRVLFKRAIEVSSVAVIVCHNHPSGKIAPSESDKLLTDKIKESGEILDIKLIDHLIITQKDYFSFADQGLI